MRSRHLLHASLGALMGVGCGGAEVENDQAGDADVTRAVTILAPAEGAQLEGTVLIRLGAEGVTIVPAGTQLEHSGHHHLFIDRDVSPAGAPIPTGEGVVHLGAAQTEYALEGLPPGEHTVIAVLGDYQHVRLPEVASDTVRFTVR